MRRALVRALSAPCVATGNFATVGDTWPWFACDLPTPFIAAIFRY
jgi:hypothetical protein